MTEQNKQIASHLFDQDVWIEKLVWLAAMHTTPGTILEELCESDPDSVIIALGLEDKFKLARTPPNQTLAETFRKEAEEEDEDVQAEEVIHAAGRAGKYGFLVEVATPVMTYDKPEDEDSTATFSLGHYHAALLYAEDLNSAFVEQALAWKRLVNSMDRESQRKSVSG